MKAFIMTALAGGLLAMPAVAQQNSGGGMQGALQGLLSGNQSQDQAVRNAYERGYQRGYEDGGRMSSNRGGGDRAYGSSDRNPSGSGEPPYGAGGQYRNQNYPAQGYGTNQNR